ncbi:carboxyl transferase domain-containing protein [Streptomyces sp. NPDC088354]|uniref:carboxyl transferase domain-containing protein n=1 Tax=Streptomyces sp. NPDC088354 TaxID=3365856 RepID=UPI0037FE8679
MTEPPRRPGSLQFVDAVVDPGTWRGWDRPLSAPPPHLDGEEYRADLARARARTGLDESVVTGEGDVRGRRVAVVAGEFGFLGGSIGVAAGERLVRAIERATRERLPLLAAPASGGTRMQEGTIAFLQMVKVAAAITDHRAAGLPYLVHLRHPTTGGVLASWGSLGHVTTAEPGALIGFLGPRVHEALYGEPFPPGVQVAENLLAHGIVDAVVPLARLAGAAARALAVLCGEAAPAVADGPGDATAGDVPAAESIRRSRRPERPGLRALLTVAGQDVTLLSGTGAGERDPGLLLALARIGGTPCVVLGHDRHETDDGRSPALGPAGLRMARRGMRIAAELDLPLLSVVDTAGAALSREAEEGGLAGEIARSLADLVTLPSPTLCLLLGQGAGGGALALLPADRVLAARHAWLSPLPPEGASAILYRTTGRADEVAARQGVRSADLLARGIVDRVVEEAPDAGRAEDAADAPEAFLTRLGTILGAELAGLRTLPRAPRLAARRARYRELGLH